MGRGKSSMTSRGGLRLSYPKDMDSLIGDDGHISLRPEDYARFSRVDIESFLVARDYEVAVIFGPDGRVVDMSSRWSPDEVVLGAERAAQAIYDDGSRTGDGYTDFHTHPRLKPDEPPIFSTFDVHSYVESVVLRDQYGYETPDTFSVLASDGHRFSLKYVGGGNYTRFESDYMSAVSGAMDIARGAHSGDVERVRDATTRIDSWLRGNALSYGFEYASNWRCHGQR